MEIDKKLYEDIKKFCELNNIDDVEKQINECLTYGFNVLKYGDNPFSYHNPMNDKNVTVSGDTEPEVKEQKTKRTIRIVKK